MRDTSPNPRLEKVKRLLVVVPILTGVALIAISVTWPSLFHYVPPGKVLVVISKTGQDLPPGQLLAKPGQKGIQEDVLGEGRHFVTPFVNEVELADAIE